MKKTYAWVLSLAMAALIVHAAPVITSESGYSITWDGNNGDFLNGTPPTNLATTGTAFASSVIGGGAFAAHQIDHLNDGVYGNDSSWIGDTNPADAWVLFDGLYDIASFAFGRDNNAGLGDRSWGIYTIDMTSDGGTNWFTIGTLDYTGGIQAGFDPSYRHEYEVSLSGGAPIEANGFRITTSSTNADANTSNLAIDEIEVYAVPEASTLWLTLLSLGCVGLCRRHSAGRIC